MQHIQDRLNYLARLAWKQARQENSKYNGADLLSARYACYVYNFALAVRS